MDAYLDFTLDPVNFPESQMAALVTSLHANNQRFVPIIDPGIYVRDEEYDAYKEGMKQNVFVMDMTGETPYLGQVWPGPTYFPGEQVALGQSSISCLMFGVCGDCDWL